MTDRPTDHPLLEIGARALAEAYDRYRVEGTPADGERIGPPFELYGPWYVIDALKAEPEVNHPGELVEEFQGKGGAGAAHRKRWALCMDAALDALCEAGVVLEQGWQPVAMAPRDGTRVLGYFPEQIKGATICETYRVAGFEDDPSSGWWACPTRFFHQPTYWRPLPAPPATGGDHD